MDAADAVDREYQAHYRRLVGQVYALTADLAEAQDVVQEAYARVLARPGGFLAAGDPEAWMRTVALNVARSRFRRRRLFRALVHSGRVTPAPDAVPGITPDRLALVAALRRLPRPTREAVVLHHLADLPIDEVAATLRVPVGTVKARLSRGRAALATYLAEEAADGAGRPRARKPKQTREPDHTREPMTLQPTQTREPDQTREPKTPQPTQIREPDQTREPKETRHA